MSYEWDLSSLYSGPDDPAILRDLEAALRMAETLSKGLKQAPLNDPYELLALIKEYEGCISLALQAYIYSELYYYLHLTDATSQKLYRWVREIWIELRERLMKVKAWLSARETIPRTWFETCPSLGAYKHWFEKSATFAPYNPRGAQGVSELKDLFKQREELLGRYHQLCSNIRTDGGLSLNEALSLMNDSTAPFRDKIYANLLDMVKEQKDEFAHILILLAKNHLHEAKLRGVSSPMKKLWLLNEMGEGFGMDVVRRVERSYEVAKNYLALRRKALGKGRITMPDLYISTEDGQWEGRPKDALELIKSSIGQLDPLFSDLVEGLIKNKCLDLEPRPTKRQGAICKALVPFIPPYIMMSYGGGWRDLATLSHEVGHAIHYMLSSERGCLNFRPVPVLEETVAAFFEFFVLFKCSSKLGKGPSLSMVMDDIMKSLFRQNIITHLELWIYQKTETHSLDAHKISRQWVLLNKKLYGDEVEFPKSFGISWALIPHIFEKPFYCSNYVVASLLALNLLNYAIKETRDFSRKFLRLLRAGASRPAPDILAELTPGLKDMAFLESSTTLLEGFMETISH